MSQWASEPIVSEPESQWTSAGEPVSQWTSATGIYYRS